MFSNYIQISLLIDFVLILSKPLLKHSVAWQKNIIYLKNITGFHYNQIQLLGFGEDVDMLELFLRFESSEYP